MSSHHESYKNKSLDGRVKILPSQYPDVIAYYESVKSLRKTAFHFKVSHRLIFWIVHPEKLKEFQERNRANQHWLKYYSKEGHKQAIRQYRKKKRALFISWVPMTQKQKDRQNTLRREAYARKKALKASQSVTPTP